MLKFLRSFALAAAMLLPFAAQAQCDAITVFPWTEDFESMTASTVPTCWDNSASGSSTLSSNPERIWGVYSYGGNQMIRMYNYYVQSGTTLINTPTLALPTGVSYELTFNYSHRASCGAFTVKVSTDGGTTFSDLQTYANTATNDQNNPGTFTETTISLAAYAGQSIILQFFATADYNAGSIFVDDIRVGAPPTCFKVTDLAVVSTQTPNSSLTLSWSDATNPNATYTVMNGTEVVASNVDVTSYTVTGLDANTDYTFSVIANCSATDASEAVIISARTACDPISTIPYSWDFESMTNDAVPECWAKVGEGNAVVKSNASNSHESSKYLDFRGSTSNLVVLPMTAVEANTLKMSLWLRPESGHSNCGTFSVGYVTNASDASTFVALATYPYTEFSSSSVAYGQREVMFESAPAGARMALRANPLTNSYYWYIDDVTIDVLPSCIPVSALAASAATSSSITLDWASNASSFTILNMADGSVLGTSTTPTFTVSGLDANTAYTFGVYVNCAGEESDTVTISTRTACGPIASLPYTCSFEAVENPSGSNVLPFCWTKYNGGVGNYPYSYSSSSNAKSGTYSLYYYYSSYGTYPDSMIAVLPQVDITTLPLNTLRLRFFGRGNYSGVGGDIQVGTMSDPSDPSTFTLVQTVSVSGSSYADEPFTVTGFPATTDQYIALLFVHGTSAASIYLDDLTLDLLPSCLEPTGLALADMTASSFTFSWSGSAAGYTATLYDADNTVVGTPQTVTDTFCTFTGLTVGSTYTVKVVANCGSETSPEVSLAATLDYCTPNPTSVDGNGIIGVAFGGMTNTTAHPTAAPFYMNNSAMAGSVPAGTQASVDITYNTGSYMYYDYGTIIWVDWNNNLMFDADEVVASGQSANVANAVLNLTFTVPATTPVGNYRMRIAGADSYFDDYVNSGTGTPNPCFSNSYSVAEDYTLTVTEAPSCMPVSALAVHAATDTSITLTWSDDNATATYTVLNGTEVVATGLAELTYTVTGLAANTEYTFAVVANCSATENSDTAYVTGRTVCAAVALPYAYGFEEADMYSCWTTANADANTGRAYDSYGTSTMNGDYSFRFYYNTNPPQYLISPELTGTENGLAASFYYKNSSTTWSETFHVGYSTTDNDVNSFTWGEEITASNTQWTLFSEMMPAGTKYVAVKLTSNNMYYLYIDDVVFAAPATVIVASADATMGSVEPAGDSIVASGSEFTVTATAEQGYMFTAWLSGTDTISTVNPFTFTVDGDTSLTAHFELGYATLTVASADATMGSVEPEGDSLVLIGSDIQLTATPADHYHFVAWLSGTDTVSTDNPLTYTMAGDTTLTAHFAIDQHTVTLSADATMGTVEPAGDSIVDYGTEFSATATALEGYSFVAWLAGTDTVGTDATLVFTVESDTALTAVFSLNQYTVTLATADAALGTVESLGDTVVSHGSELVIEATAEEGAYFVAWLSGEDTVSAVNPLTLTVTSDSALTAHFSVYTYTLTASVTPDNSGSITGVPSEAVAHGTTVSLTAVPAEGFHFVSWSNGATDANIVIVVTSDTNLVATFEANPANTFTVSVAFDATMGAVEGVPTEPVVADSVVTLVAVAAEGYHFTGWSNGVTTDTLNVTVVSDTMLTASFAINKYVVDAYSLLDEFGTVTGVPTDSVEHGTVVTLTAEPAEGYHFTAWSNGLTDATINVTVVSDTTLVPLFAINMYAVNLSVEGDGNISGIDTDSVQHGTVITLTAVPAAGYHFVGWSNGATDITTSFTIVSDTAIAATFEANAAGTFTVAVDFNPDYGTVNGIPTEAVTADSVITLTAVPNNHVTFLGWLAGEDTISTDLELSLTVTSDTALVALFQFNPDTVFFTVAVNDATLGSIDPAAGNYHLFVDEQMTFTATPVDTTVEFRGWRIELNGEVNLNIPDETYTFTATQTMVGADVVLTAMFAPVDAAPDSLYLTLAVNDEAMGTTTPAPGTYAIAVNDTNDHLLIATANRGYRFVRWDVTSSLSNSSVEEDTTLFPYVSSLFANANFTYTAIFEADPNYVEHTVNVTLRNTVMGSVDPMGIHNVEHGTDFTVSATAFDGYHFVAWLNGNDTVSTDAEYTFTVLANITLTAIFAEDPMADLFLVTGEVNDATMGYVMGAGYYEAGAEVTLTAQANAGYKFVRWNDNVTEPSRTFTVTADTTYTAIFEAVPVDIDDVEAAEVEIFAAEGRIVVRGAESDIYLYDVNGRVLSHQAAAATVEFTVSNTGVYLVKVGNAAAKRVAVVR